MTYMLAELLKRNGRLNKTITEIKATLKATKIQ